MTIDPAQWARARPILEAALELDQAAREAHVRESCGGDAELASLVSRLLDAARDDGFLAGLAPGALDLFGAPAPDHTGRTVGPYRLVRLLGLGGMGAVYLAERVDGEFERRVAIKLMRAGPVADEAVRRFRRERQIMARLDHPRIARLLDGGVADTGPYLVMEYVEGQPIDGYCGEAGLSLDQCLTLFLAVCDAVDHAHRNLILHRDLKPSNILVTGSGDVRLLDFGIARLLDAGAADDPATGTAGAPLTVQYASPEQLRGEPLSTASDVYSLGCVLYRLLTGRLPHQLEGLSASAIERRVSDETPVRPGSLRRELRGDLDTILLKALHRDPSRRYQSVAGLADDLRRHLDRRPVSARPDTLTYRASRFVRRHRIGVVATMIVGIAVAGGVVATAAEGRRAQRRFVEVRQLANALLFDLHDAVRNLPGATTVRQMLVSRALEYLDLLRRETPTDPALQLELASAYEQIGEIQGDPHRANLGDLAGALQSYRQAFELRQAVWRRDTLAPDMRRALANSYGRLAVVTSWSGRNDEAIDLSRRALGLLAPGGLPPPGAPGAADAGRIASELGWWLIWSGRVEEGLAEIEGGIGILRALVVGESAGPEERLDLWRAYSYRVDGLRFSNRFRPSAALLQDTALPYLNELTDRYPHNPRVQYAQHTCHYLIGIHQTQLGNAERAARAHRTSLAFAELMVQSDSANQKAFEALARASVALGEVLGHERRIDEAVPAFERGIDGYRHLIDRNPRNAELSNQRGYAELGLCRALYRSGRHPAALRWCRASEASFSMAVASHRSNAVVRGNLGTAYVSSARVLRSLARTAPPDSATVLRRLARGRFEDGLRLFDELRTVDATPEIQPDTIRAELAALAREDRGRRR